MMFSLQENAPMWTQENRSRYNRDKLRYPSDLTDEEWALIAPLIPPARRGGRRRSVNVREVTKMDSAQIDMAAA